MSYDNTPNRLESAFIQRDNTNTYYEQVNLSGSNLVIYHDENGILTADNVYVWATHYGIGSGGQSLSSSWASASVQAQYATQSLFATQSVSASYAGTASYLLGGAGNSESSSWASASLQAQYTTQSLYATQSISSSHALTASYLLDYAPTVSASWASASIQSQYATQSISASYITASNIVGNPLSASYALTASHAFFAYASQSITASYALSSGTASLVINPNVSIDSFGNASLTSYVSIGGSSNAGKLIVLNTGGDVVIMSGSISASNYYGRLMGRADTAISASWASASISSSYALFTSTASGSISSSYAFYAATTTGSGIIGTLAFAYACNTASLARTASYITASNISGRVPTALTASNADTASYAFQAANSFTAVSASYAPVTGEITNAQTASMALSINFVPSASLSASWASSSVSSSYAENAATASAITFVPRAAVSASWVSASALITTAQTASFVTASNVRGVVASASYAYLAVSASSLTFVPNAANFTTQSQFATQSLFASQSILATQSLYATQSNFATQSISASYVSGSGVDGTVLTAVSASWASASFSSSYSINAASASYTSNVASASYVPGAGVDGLVSASYYAVTASLAWKAFDADRAISASYAPQSGEVLSAVSASYAKTASLVVTSSYAFVTQNALAADFALLAGEALSADFAVNAGNTLFTSSYALTASFALNGGGGGGGGANGTSPTFKVYVTASMPTQTGTIYDAIATAYISTSNARADGADFRVQRADPITGEASGSYLPIAVAVASFNTMSVVNYQLWWSDTYVSNSVNKYLISYGDPNGNFMYLNQDQMSLLKKRGSFMNGYSVYQDNSQADWYPNAAWGTIGTRITALTNADEGTAVFPTATPYLYNGIMNYSWSYSANTIFRYGTSAPGGNAVFAPDVWGVNNADNRTLWVDMCSAVDGWVLQVYACKNFSQPNNWFKHTIRYRNNGKFIISIFDTSAGLQATYPTNYIQGYVGSSSYYTVQSSAVITSSNPSTAIAVVMEPMAYSAFSGSEMAY